MPFDAIQSPQEIEMPPRPAKFAIGDRRQTGGFLLFDDIFDLAVLDRFELIGADFTFSSALARLLERGRPQQAADMIGAKRRRLSLAHALISSF
jgi:hypothetical protein